LSILSILRVLTEKNKIRSELLETDKDVYSDLRINKGFLFQ
jgi:hypothetical protein